MPKIQAYGKIFKGEKIVLNILIFREKLKKTLNMDRKVSRLPIKLTIWTAFCPFSQQMN